MTDDTPAVPAPASRSGEARRAALCFAGGMLHLNIEGKSRLFIGDSDVAVEYDEDGNSYVELDRTEIEFLRDKLNAWLPVSRDSGKAVKLAARLQSLAENEDLSDLDDCEKGADMLLSLSASAARQRLALEQIRDGKYTGEFHPMRIADEALSPAASPPEGRTQRPTDAEIAAAQLCAGGIDPGSGPCPKCGATDDDSCPYEGKAPADGAEE